MGAPAYWFDPNYKEYKEREAHQWRKYLSRWSNHYDGNMAGSSLGVMSTTVLDKYLYGDQRLQQPPQYERVCEEFINLAEKSGVDPAKPLYETIKKMVTHYYPEDLDSYPDETKQVIKPNIQWVYQTDLDAFIEEENKKPKPNTLSRYLWHIPGWQEFHHKVMKTRAEEEEKLLMSLGGAERQKYYEKRIKNRERIGMELNDYLPLLAYRPDRKTALANYYMNSDNEQEIERLSQIPGGIKQIFVNAGIISSDHQPIDISKPEFRY